jgi:PAS domain S-box-containing protein
MSESPDASVRLLYAAAGGDDAVPRELVGDPETTVAGASTASEVLDEVDDTDCLVVAADLESTRWPAVIETVRDRRPGVPVVVSAGSATEAAATTALRAGASDYVAEGESLLERVRATGTEVTDDQRQVRENQRVLRDLYDLSTDPEDDVEDRVERMLELGRDRLGVANAFLARVDRNDSEWYVLQAVGDTDLIGPGDRRHLQDTYCRKAIESRGLLGVHDATETGYGDYPAYREMGVACYLGGKVVVDGELYGTVCFADRVGREPFSDPERRFVEVLIAWVRYELARSERERRLESAHERVENTLERIGDAFFALDREWRFSYVNDRAGELVERDPGELVGERIWEAFPAAAGSSFESAYREAFESQEPVTFEAEFPPLSAWFEVSAYPDEDGLSVFFRDVTERKERERELKQYERVLEAVRGMVYALDEDGHFTVVTAPLAAMMGYDREEILGTHAGELLDEDVFERGKAAVGTLAREGGDSTTIEADVETADGEVVPVEVELSTLSDEAGRFRGSVGVVYDRSDLAAVQDRLQRERDRFSFLFESLPDPLTEVGFVDSEPVLRSVNNAFRETFCPDAVEVVGRSVNEFVFAADETDDAERIDERILAGERVTAEVRRETVAGPRDFLFRGVPYLGEDVVDGPRVFGIYTDITEQKRYERRLEVLHRVLRHNLRNRTTAIDGFARRIERTVDDPEVAEAAEKLRENADALDGLNDKAKTIEQAASPNAGDEGPVDAAELARTVAEGYDDRPGGAVDTDLPDTCIVAADDRLATALENLVENAVAHADNVEVGIEATDRGGDWVELYVADDGPGIPEHERAVVGGEREITQLEHGSGLGLWLVRWVVEAVGGDIEFGDPDDEGSRVALHLRRSE